MKDKEKIKKLQPFEESKYENVDLDHLIMYAMAQLEKMGADLSFENAVVAAFKLFPNKFSLLGYSSYPDSLRIYTCLWRCSTDKKKQWLGGKIRQGFNITDRSRIFIKEAEDLLGGISFKKMRAPSQTRRKESLLAEITSSSAYSKYIKNQSNNITDAEICFVLQGTLDSSREILRENFISFKRFAEELERTDILRFLNWIEQHFQKIIGLSKDKEG